MGKNFKYLVENKIKEDSISNELNLVRKNLNQFKNTHFDKLREIRNASIAHKDKNIINQITIIKQINWSDTIGLIVQFDKILNDLGDLFQKLINLGLDNFDELKIN